MRHHNRFRLFLAIGLVVLPACEQGSPETEADAGQDVVQNVLAGFANQEFTEEAIRSAFFEDLSPIAGVQTESQIGRWKYGSEPAMDASGALLVATGYDYSDATAAGPLLHRPLTARLQENRLPADAIANPMSVLPCEALLDWTDPSVEPIWSAGEGFVDEIRIEFEGGERLGVLQ